MKVNVGWGIGAVIQQPSNIYTISLNHILALAVWCEEHIDAQ